MCKSQTGMTLILEPKNIIIVAIYSEDKVQYQASFYGFKLILKINKDTQRKQYLYEMAQNRLKVTRKYLIKCLQK